MNSVGGRIYKLRKELGMTQDELAQRLGYKSKSSINKIEMGKSEFPQKKLMQFASALETSPGYLLGLVCEETAKRNAELASYINLMKQCAVDPPELEDLDCETIQFTQDFYKLSPSERFAIRQLMDVFLQNK